MVAIRNMSLLSSSKTVSELFGGVRVMIARTRNDFTRYRATRRRREIHDVGMLIVEREQEGSRPFNIADDEILIIGREINSRFDAAPISGVR